MIPFKVSRAPLTALVLMIALLSVEASMPGLAQTASATPAAQVPAVSQSSNTQPQLQQRYPRYVIQQIGRAHV